MKNMIRSALALFLVLSLLCSSVYAEELAEEVAADEIEVIGVDNVEDVVFEAGDMFLDVSEAQETIEEPEQQSEQQPEQEAEPETDQGATEETEGVSETIPEELPAEDTLVAEVSEALPEAPAEEVPVALMEDAEEGAVVTEPVAEDRIVIGETADTSAKLMGASVNGMAAVNGKLTVRHKAVVTMNKGDAVQLVVEGKTIKSCKSSKKKVASVTKGGRLTAKKAGKTKLTIKLKGKKKPIKVTVKVADPWRATSVRLDRAGTVTIGKGQTLKLNATMTTASGKPSTSTLKWKSSKKKVATVNKYGLVKGKKKGKTKITVKTSSGKKASVTIKVVKAWQDLGDGEETAEEEGGRWRDDLVQAAIDATNQKRAA